MVSTTIDQNFNESQDNLVYCEMCEVRHINNTWCQAPYNPLYEDYGNKPFIYHEEDYVIGLGGQ